MSGKILAIGGIKPLIYFTEHIGLDPSERSKNRV